MTNCYFEGKRCKYLIDKEYFCELHPEKWFSIPRSEVPPPAIMDSSVCGEYVPIE